MTRLVTAVAVVCAFAVASPARAGEDTMDDLKASADAIEECGNTVSSCGGADAAKAWEKMRDACKDLRVCKQKCSKDKAACEGAARAVKRDCKAEAKGDKNAEQKCRRERKDAHKSCRAARRDCAKDCRAELKTPACKDARQEFWKTLGKAVKSCSEVVEEGCSDVYEK